MVTRASAKQQRCASVNLTDMSCTRATLADLCEQIKLFTQQKVELLQRVSTLEFLVSKFSDKNDGQDSAADVAKSVPKKKTSKHSKKPKALDNSKTDAASADVNDVQITDQECGIDQSPIENDCELRIIPGESRSTQNSTAP